MRGVDKKETMGLGFSVWLKEAELKKKEENSET